VQQNTKKTTSLDKGRGLYALPPYLTIHAKASIALHYYNGITDCSHE